jgi:hypothetical protein
MITALAQRRHHQQHRRPINTAPPKQYRWRQLPPPAALLPTAQTQADCVDLIKSRRTSPRLTQIRGVMQRPPAIGQRFNRTRSARSTSIWCKRIKSDLLWRICGDIILPPFWRQEPLQRIGQDKRGGSFPFPRSSWLNQIIFPPFSVAALKLHWTFSF